MFANNHTKNSIEPLEARIAPASLIASAKFIPALTGSPIILHAGEVLTTAGSINIPGVGTVGAGSYLLYVEKGDCIVFTTDFNNNKVVDFNEITGIAAGDGLRLTSFVDIHGDIVTNLRSNTTLSDTDNNSSNDDQFLKGDGRVVLNSTIEKIELRSLTTDDVLDENGDGDTTNEVLARLALTSYSIHGNVHAGKGFGVVNANGTANPNSGLIIDDSGRVLLATDFNTNAGIDFYAEDRTPLKPTVGFIRTGSAVSGEWFSFGISAANDVNGYLSAFQADSGVAGGDIAGVRATGTFNISGLIAGDGGVGARGGNISGVVLNGDNAGGYTVKAGNGGRGPTGGVGGSIIDFQDLSSETGQIIVQSGNGGNATTGVGGNAGQVTFGTMNVNGGLGINLGSGGDGFTGGGNGASLARAVITTPEGGVQTGSSNIGSTHQGPINPLTGRLADDAYGVIGRHFGIDFDHDGFGDAVFSNTTPNQLTVGFGDGFGGLREELTSDPTALPGKFFRLELDAPINPEALTVADFNHDGFLDIATASSASGNFSGVYVFLALTEDANDDGVLTDAEDIDGDGVIDFNGFRTARQSVLPAFSGGDPDDPLLIGFYDYMRSAAPITDLEAGDFNGDGLTDLAVVSTQIDKGLLRDRQILTYLTPDVENGRPTGQFYANVGTKSVAEPPQGANPFVPFVDIGGGTRSVIQATALTFQDTYDVVVASVVGSSRIAVFDNSFPSRLGPLETTFIRSQDWGRVDTNRDLGPNNISREDVTVRDFAVLDSAGEPFTDTNNNGILDGTETFSDTNGNGEFDPDSDGIADISFITENLPGFMVSMISRAGFFDTNVTNNGQDNGGTWFGGRGYDLSSNVMAIRDADTDGDGLFDNVAVLVYGLPGNLMYAVAELDIANAPPTDIQANPGAVLLNTYDGHFGGGTDNSIVAFDTFYPLADNTSVVDYITATPSSAQNGAHFEDIIGDLDFLYFTDISQHYIRINAGNGGDSLVGKGGTGGFLGGNLQVVTDLVGDLSITLPANLAYSGIVELTAGAGGNGFSSGGNGGNISGTTLRYVDAAGTRHTNVLLYAGDGGFGVGGRGGDGGDLIANSIETGIYFEAGDGGRGRNGGNGGDIIGHNIANFYDTRDIFQELIAGAGGNGVKKGGVGGNITNFKGDFGLVVAGAVSGYLSYIAGAGGNAISGPGGAGGSITNASPLTDDAHLGGDILLQAGIGGNGLTGGAGGNVNTFIFKPSDTDNPAVLSLLAGDGGRGITGPGGKGGNIADINIPTKGTPNADSLPLTPYTFNRILAGNGGSSSGNIGGAGGSVLRVDSLNSDGPFVIAAGAGGSGLSKGGVGGSVKDTILSVGGASFAKALVVAGAGGDASAFIPNPSDASIVKNQEFKAFGGVIGKGGKGGNIENFQQTGAIQARVDLIAGDGGSTLNYGTAAQQGIPVGKGGTIQNVELAGSIGNISPTVPIKSYNNIFIGETVADFLDANLRDPLVPGNLSDSSGLVGLVVGSAGRIKATQVGYDDANNALFRSQPALFGVNGSAIDITARDIMSMVAGSVERIAAIQVISGIQVTANGVYGADKTVDPAPYRDKDGNPTPEPFLDGRLVDGAIIYKTFTQLFPGDKAPPPPRTFQLGG